jgi:radical SAM protein with 4Fe4S-binding SPASM domain
MKHIARKNPEKYGYLPLYFYLSKAYPKFLAIGKCLDFPFSVQIQTQSLCNGRCSICPYPTVSQKLEQGRMDWELYQKIADEVAKEPLLTKVLFELHNEPLLDKRTFDCIKYIKSIAPSKNCALVTNGEPLDKFSTAEITESNLDSLMISLNAHSKEVYQQVNNGLDYERVMKNTNRLLSDETIRYKIGLSFVVTEKNVQEVPEATRYWQKQGVRTRVIAEISNRAGTLAHYEKLRLKTGYRGTPLLARLWQHLLKGPRQVIGCHRPFYQMSVLFNGDVIVCCHDWNRTTVIGNAKTSSLREIWNSDRMNEIRRIMLKKDYQQLEPCRDCSIVKR